MCCRTSASSEVILLHSRRMFSRGLPNRAPQPLIIAAFRRPIRVSRMNLGLLKNERVGWILFQSGQKKRFTVSSSGHSGLLRLFVPFTTVENPSIYAGRLTQLIINRGVSDILTAHFAY